MTDVDTIDHAVALRNVLLLAADTIDPDRVWTADQTIAVPVGFLAELLRESAGTYAELADRDPAPEGLAAAADTDPAVQIANLIVDGVIHR
jgi:hypothetical protein